MQLPGEFRLYSFKTNHKSITAQDLVYLLSVETIPVIISNDLSKQLRWMDSPFHIMDQQVTDQNLGGNKRRIYFAQVSEYELIKEPVVARFYSVAVEMESNFHRNKDT